tara:strand:- start:10427 stop:10867 length:441 start_codon:yes stop_codon:yes gene_type:complete
MATKRTTPKRITRLPWSVEHVQFLINNMHLSNDELAARLGRTRHAIENKLSKIRKTHNIDTKSNAIVNKAMENTQPNEGFYFAEDSGETTDNKQLSMLQIDDNVFEQKFEDNQVEYTVTWKGAKITFKASGMYIGTNGLPKFVLEE